MKSKIARSVVLALASANLVCPATTMSAFASEPAFTVATTTTSMGAAFASSTSQTALSHARKLQLLQQNIKYVFVIFQENRSFDHYFGTYPGANGLTSTFPGADPTDPAAQPANTFSSYNSVIRNPDGTYGTVSPFLIPRTVVNQQGVTVNVYPESLLSVDHSHTGYINDFHLQDTTHQSSAANDGYPLDQEGLHFATTASNPVDGPTGVVTSTGSTPGIGTTTLQQKQKGEIVMGHLDCDTIPFLWQYADRFAMSDNMHQTSTGPSTPNAIAMIAGQGGDTQWVKHPLNVNSKNTTAANGPANTNGVALSLPNLTDTPPFPGSVNDTTAGAKPPYGPDESANTATVETCAYSASPSAACSFTSYPGGNSSPNPMNIVLTFASLPLSFMGTQIGSILSQDENPVVDLTDVGKDIQAIAVKHPNVDWGWYQQGYGPESFDGCTTATCVSQGGLHENANSSSYVFANGNVHASYVVHHNGPQYFGYIGDNTFEQGKMHGLTQFFTDVAGGNLSANGGVYYVRGGYYNNDGLLPADPNPVIKHSMPGNDDHANYSDSQISEAMVADAVNAIAASQYWSKSAIIITYDESDGFYDHQPEQFRTWGPDGEPETGGPRIPLIVVSPYAAAHTVSHVYSEHSAVIKFIDQLFGLTPLSRLPDEAAAMVAGANNAAFNAPGGVAQTLLGPADGWSGMGDLFEMFDNDRLLGNVPVLTASYASIPSATVLSLPHYGGAGCNALDIVPTDYTGTAGALVAGTESDAPPADFNPRPTLSNGSPYYNTTGNTTACTGTIGSPTNAPACTQGTGAPANWATTPGWDAQIW